VTVVEAEIDSILRYGDSRLRQVCQPVQPGTPEVRQLVGRLWNALRQQKGWGLAAPQLGVTSRVAVICDPRPRAGGERLVLVNPELVELGGTQVQFAEGCLSFPGLYCKLTRPTTVRLRYHDLDGRQRETAVEGLLARAALHEMEHLDGILFIDHLSTVKRWLLGWRLRKLMRPRGAKA